MLRFDRASGFKPALLGLLIVAPLSLLNAQAPSTPRNYDGAAGGPKILEEGQPPVIIHPTVDDARRAREANHKLQSASTSSELSYHGGTGGIGVETAPKIYLVFWGSQWSSDPTGEATILQNFYDGVGGSSWLNSVTQYCQGVASGTVYCDGAGSAAGNPPNLLVNVWYDNASAAPSRPRQSQLAAEAVRAATHFGNASASKNAGVQYVIATAHNNNAQGFGSQYCAWHSYTSSSKAGNIAYTNLPYMTDAGASCGANFNNLGAKAGITIVGGHEMAETITDQFPSSGWTDSSGSENGDKCAWISSGQGASASVKLSTGIFPVQSLWSNAFNSDAGGCVLSY